MRLLVSGLIRDSGKMFEEQRSPNCYGTVFPVPLPVVQALFAGHRMLMSAILATVKCSKVSIPSAYRPRPAKAAQRDDAADFRRTARNAAPITCRSAPR